MLLSAYPMAAGLHGVRGFEKLSTKEYDALYYVRSSDLKFLADKTPAHLAHKRLNPEPISEAMAVGLALHCQLLEPDNFKRDFCLLPSELDLRKYRDREFLEEFKQINAGKIFLQSKWMADIVGMATSVQSHPSASQLLQNTEREMSVRWTEVVCDDDDPGKVEEVLCKSRLDAFSKERGFLGELKSTKDASPSGFRREIEEFHYHLSAAMYFRGANLHSGDAFKNFVFIAVENFAPYLCAVRELSPEYLDDGLELYEKMLRKYIAGGAYSDEPEIIYPYRYRGKQSS